jgi:hypothetical protein
MPSHIVFMCCNYQQPEPAHIKKHFIIFSLEERAVYYPTVGGGARGVSWGGGAGA